MPFGWLTGTFAFYSQSTDCGEKAFEEMRTFVLNIEFKVLIGPASRAGWPMVTLTWGTECEHDSCTEEGHQEVVSVWRIWWLQPWEWMRW